MLTYVLDSSALIRYLDNEAGGDRIEEILVECIRWKCRVWISAVQWGEVGGNLRKRFGAAEEARVMSSLIPSEAEVIPATAERAVRAADLRVDKKIAYADAFAVDLAMDSADHVLVSADYGFKTVEDLIKIEFLPLK